MTERDWLDCTDPQRMLEFLGGTLSDRRLRLFACACLRRVWSLLVEQRSRAGVEVNERYADGLAGGDELWTAAIEARKVEAAAKGVWLAEGPADSLWRAGRAAEAAAEALERAAAREALKKGQQAVAPAMQVAGETARRVQAELLRDLAGSLRPLAFDPAWKTPTAVLLARAADDERGLPGGELDPVRRAVLADALEETGCTEPAILQHLRSSGPHVRGCFAVDAVLGKA
jgi:hypothetical protein